MKYFNLILQFTSKVYTHSVEKYAKMQSFMIFTEKATFFPSIQRFTKEGTKELI